MPNSGICEKSPQFQHLAASLGFIKKIEKSGDRCAKSMFFYEI